MIAFAREERFRFQIGNVRIRGAEFAVQFFEQVFSLLWIRFFLREMNVCFKVAGQRGELFVRGNLLFGTFALTENALRSFLIAPEIGVGDAGFERV